MGHPVRGTAKSPIFTFLKKNVVSLKPTCSSPAANRVVNTSTLHASAYNPSPPTGGLSRGGARRGRPGLARPPVHTAHPPLVSKKAPHRERSLACPAVRPADVLQLWANPKNIVTAFPLFPRPNPQHWGQRSSAFHPQGQAEASRGSRPERPLPRPATPGDTSLWRGCR